MNKDTFRTWGKVLYCDYTNYHIRQELGRVNWDQLLFVQVHICHVRAIYRPAIQSPVHSSKVETQGWKDKRSMDEEGWKFDQKDTKHM